MRFQCVNCAEWKDVESRSYRKNIQHNGFYRCAVCYFSNLRGNNNPNQTYDIDDSFFDVVDSEEKAYFLGWIASDGSVRNSSIRIELHADDAAVLECLSRLITPQGGVSPKVCKRETMHGPRAYLELNRKQLVEKVCTHLHISPGSKAHTVQFPTLADSLVRHFVRGYFEGDGSIPVGTNRGPRCNIVSNSDDFLRSVRTWSMEKGFMCSISGDHLEWNGLHALDFLSFLYSDTNLYLNRKRDSFLDMCIWQPSLPGSYKYQDGILINRTRPDAVIPSKVRSSDSGYDLTAVACIKKSGILEMYDTGIKVKPPEGFYFDVVPRSSLSKTGYILANSVGVIDRSYRGNILLALLKVDPAAPSLSLPARVAQMIPRPIVHFEVVEAPNLEDTARGEGGFGSTGGH